LKKMGIFTGYKKYGTCSQVVGGKRVKPFTSLMLYQT